MGDGPVISCFLVVTFGLMMISGIMQDVATSRLAKWLYHHHLPIWRELGRPGTTFFKGEPDNGYFSRTTALQLMMKGMPLNNYRRKFAKDEEVQRYLRQHQLSGRISAVFLIIFIIGIFVGGALHM